MTDRIEYLASNSDDDWAVKTLAQIVAKEAEQRTWAEEKLATITQEASSEVKTETYVGRATVASAVAYGDFEIAPDTEINPAVTSFDVANPEINLATTSLDTENTPANRAFESGETFSNKQALPLSGAVGELRKDLTPYRFNNADRPEKYKGARRANAVGRTGSEPVVAASTDPVPTVVYLAIEIVEGLGDSVIAASLDYGKVIEAAQKFAGALGQEVFADPHTSLTLTGQRLRTVDGALTAYKISAQLLL